MESAENREQPIQVNQPNKESPDSPSLSKVETLKLLNDSIDKLEATIRGISENSSVDLPSSASINDLVVTTQELAETVAPEENKTKNSAANAQPSIKDASVKPPAATSIASPAKNNASSPTVESQSQQNKTVLISIGVFAIALVVIALLWIWYPQYQANRTDFDSPTVTPTEITLDDISVPEIIENSDNSSEIDVEEETVAVTESLESDTPTEIPIPQDLIAPGKAKNLKLVAIEPELIFTPEQNFVAVLQTKIANLTDDYPTDFVDLIKVNLPKNTILVEVNDDWYELDESSQNQIGNSVLERIRQLKFNKLKFQDSTGKLVARNPVIGDNIIILETDSEQEKDDGSLIMED